MICSSEPPRRRVQAWKPLWNTRGIVAAFGFRFGIEFSQSRRRPGFRGEARQNNPDRNAKDAFEGEAGEQRQKRIARHGREETGFQAFSIT